jgi:16S rRNA (adenine1518-N6/adenine1519-N6)-dimethyltransferase
MTFVHPKNQLRDRGLAPKHHFGQNFLADASVSSRIANEAAPTGTQYVIEIGAGLGALTEELLQRCPTVTAIERDRDLIHPLQEKYSEFVASGQLRIEECDAKTFDYVEHFRAMPKPASLAGNLPYQLTGPLLRRCIEVSPLVARCVFLVQLEVADRLSATPGADDYGALTVFLQAQYAVQKAFVVRRGSFFPQPNVDSAVVVLRPLDCPVIDETPVFRALVKSAFAQRRKKLRNAWSGVAGTTSEQLQAAAAQATIDLNLRGEVLSVSQFAGMANALAAAGA